MFERTCPSCNGACVISTGSADVLCVTCSGIGKVLHEKPQCVFDMGWHGLCKKDATNGSMCEEHAKLECTVCGNPATSLCDATMGGMICGAPICKDCTHELDQNGCNNEEFKHVPKNSMRFTPWYYRGVEDIRIGFCFYCSLNVKGYADNKCDHIESEHCIKAMKISMAAVKGESVKEFAEKFNSRRLR